MYDKFFFINYIGLIKVTHILKIFVKTYPRFFGNKVSFVFRGGKILDEKLC
jgi:hypothetical protein